MEIYQGKIKGFFKEFKNILEEKKVYLIVDENTVQHINYVEEKLSVSSTYLKLESGEKNKTFNNVLKIYVYFIREARRGPGAALERDVRRRPTVLALSRQIKPYLL